MSSFRRVFLTKAQVLHEIQTVVTSPETAVMVKIMETCKKTIAGREPLADTPEEKWSEFKEVVTVMAALGPKRRVHQDWFETKMMK
ncbi:hypothetical protein RRG08_060870 [Elysia crispata]|uniref:Uncharacterized protein n=1 Tax=Elysia crispata TaxID=231223 RepID=A0AAE1DGD8_9GAST|nr:hypothetical protein RRG08_060870 [Elysia crispata]